jgi:hypothetical protein
MHGAFRACVRRARRRYLRGIKGALALSATSWHVRALQLRVVRGRHFV